MITCEDCTAFVDGKLDPDRAAEFREHLRDCESCQVNVLEGVRLSAQISTPQPTGPLADHELVIAMMHPPEFVMRRMAEEVVAARRFIASIQAIVDDESLIDGEVRATLAALLEGASR